MSACLGLNLGLFPIYGLETYGYIFNECKIDSLCSILSNTDANIIALLFVMCKHNSTIC